MLPTRWLRCAKGYSGLAASLLAGSAGFGADPAVFMVPAMPFAFVGASLAKLGAGLDHAPDQGWGCMGAAHESRARGGAGTGAIEAEPDTLTEPRDASFVQASVCTGNAGLGAIETSLDTGHQCVVDGAMGRVRLARRRRAGMHAGPPAFPERRR